MTNVEKIKHSLSVLGISYGFITYNRIKEAAKARTSDPDSSWSDEEIREAYRELEKTLNVCGGEATKKEMIKAAKKEDKGELLGGRGYGKFEEEIKDDPEKIQFLVRPSRIVAMIDITFFFLIGVAISAISYYFLKHELRYSTIKYDWLYILAIVVPPSFCVLIRIKSVYRKFASRWELSRRSIQQHFFIGITRSDECDMSKVRSIEKNTIGTGSSRITNIRIITKDESLPIIKMEYLSGDLGEKVHKYITAHAISTWAEHKGSRKGR